LRSKAGVCMHPRTSGNKELMSFPMVMFATIFFIATVFLFLSGMFSSSFSSGMSPTGEGGKGEVVAVAVRLPFFEGEKNGWNGGNWDLSWWW